MDSTERYSTLKSFNDATAEVDVLVTSLLSSSFGLNLQHCCNHLIILAVADNINTVL